MTTLLYRHASSLSLICLLVLSGCVRGSGIPATEVRDLGGFSEIQNDIMVDVIFAPADTQRVELTCDDNLLDRILTEVSGDTLKIKTPPGSGISPQGV